MSTDANAPGTSPTLGHIRGLDGVRAVSLLAIIAFHTGLHSVPGGFFGVDSFFVLSVFLSTSLLVKEWGGSGTIRLSRFWAGRARRLLPALFLLVAVIGIAMAFLPGVLATSHILGAARRRGHRRGPHLPDAGPARGDQREAGEGVARR